MRVEYRPLLSMPGFMRTLDDVADYWFDELKGTDYRVFWPLGEVGASQISMTFKGAVPHRGYSFSHWQASFDEGRINRKCLLAELRRVPSGDDVTVLDETLGREEYWKDTKPDTGDTAGGRRYFSHPWFVAWEQKTVQLAAVYARVQAWSREQIRRPYAHVWVWDKDTQSPEGWSGGREIDGWSVDDMQHMEILPSWIAALLGDPGGVSACINVYQWMVHDYLSRGHTPSTAERAVCWLADMGWRFDLLGLGTEPDGSPNRWCRDFCRGVTPRAFLKVLLKNWATTINQTAFTGQKRDYKIPQLPAELWPAVGTRKRLFLGQGIEVQSDQPEVLGEYSWQWGMEGYGIAGAIAHLREVDPEWYDLEQVTRTIVECMERSAARWWVGSRVTDPVMVPRTVSFWEWSLEDGRRLLEAYHALDESFKDPDEMRLALVSADIVSLARKPGTGENSEEASLAALGVAEVAGLTAGLSKTAAMKAAGVLRLCLSTNWDRRADVIASGIRALQDAGSW